MKTEVNGKVYEAVYLTDEEKVVIDAMRAGAKVQASFHHATLEQAFINTDQLPREVLSIRSITDLTSEDSGRVSFINIRAENSDWTIELNHFIDVKQKND